MVWIIDHEIETGKEKLFAAIGVPLADLTTKGYCLSHRDMTLLDLEVVEKSNGAAVYQKTRELSERFGVPAQVVIDGGPDLVKGMELFGADRPEVVHIYDITHKLAALLKNELKNDERWIEFISSTAMTGKLTRQTDLLFAAPPGLRTKARYMNAEKLVYWAKNIIEYKKKDNFSLISNSYKLETETVSHFANKLKENKVIALSSLSDQIYANRTSFSMDLNLALGEEAFEQYGKRIINQSCLGKNRFEEKIGWIVEFEENIEEYAQLMDTIKVAKQEVRQNGLGDRTTGNFNDCVKLLGQKTSRAKSFDQKVAAALEEESAKVPSGVSTLGSSEIIESVFGKYKIFSKKRPIQTIGDMILTIPLSLKRLTPEIVKRALETVSYSDVKEWSKKTFGESALSKRITAFGKTTQNKDEFCVLNSS